MSERPPPRPLCSRMSSVSRRLVRPSSTCRTTWRISTVNLSGHDAGGQCRIEYSRTSRRASGDASGADVLLEPDDAREFVDVEAGATDERAVDIRLTQERRDVGGLHRPPVEHARALCD